MFIMERAEPPVVVSLFGQFDVGANHIHNVIARAYLCNNVVTVVHINLSLSTFLR